MTADPGLGSYLNGKPNGGVYQPYNLSLYGYASNNPASAYDPDGRFLNLLLGGVTSVAIGYGIAKLTGQEYSWTQAGIDFGVGVATSGAGAIVQAVRVARALRAGEQVATAGARAAESALVSETVAAGETVAAKAEGTLLSKVCGSFAETTPVTTSQGLKPIGDVKIGERVRFELSASPRKSWDAWYCCRMLNSVPRAGVFFCGIAEHVCDKLQDPAFKNVRRNFRIVAPLNQSAVMRVRPSAPKAGVRSLVIHTARRPSR